MKISHKGKASLIMGGQFGSEGKGLVCGYVGYHNKFDIVTTNAAPNAGHTSYYGDRKHVCYHLPTYAIHNSKGMIYLNAGSVIDPDLLWRECTENGIMHHRVTIHPLATIVRRSHQDQDANKKHGTTGKGIGPAIADKVNRCDNIAANCEALNTFRVAPIDLHYEMGRGSSVLVEVPQGYSLSLNGPSYPYVTSRNCGVAQALMDARIHHRYLADVVIVFRTYPIRIAGNSGPGYVDSLETSFEEIGQDTEYTTVTMKPRRIFTWSDQQFMETIDQNQPSHIFLNFANYMESREDLELLIDRIKKLAMPLRPEIYVGYGPRNEDVNVWDNN